MSAGFCASVAALVVALDEAGALHRDRYEEILRHFWAKLPDDGDTGDAGAVIEQVLELVEGYARGQTGRTVDLDAIRHSLSAQLTASEGIDRRKSGEKAGEERASRHQPLLGAPFVV